MKYIILIVLLLSTFLLFFQGLKNDPKLIPSNLISKEIPKFKLPSLDNRYFKDSDLRTKDLKLVNFFASWCPPCKVEHSNLIKLSQRLKIFCISKKDTVKNIKNWFSQMGNTYSKIGFEGIILGSFFNPSKKSRKVESNKTIKTKYFINATVKI